ncbi:sugar ABC transporter substrate-binding protein [Thalassotalea ganghwensis]
MLGVLLIFITIYPEKPRKQNLCLLLDDVRQAHWQAIHYGASKAAKKYNIALNSFDYQNEISAPVNDLKHHSCLKKHDAIIYGWQKETLLKSQATEQKMPIISLSDKNPNQTINQLIEGVAIKKYQLIQQWLANHANEQTLNIYLMFGQKAHYPYQLLYQKLAAHLAANDKVRILGVSYEPDFYLNQYVAYSDAISNFDTIDIIIATNIAAQAVARINKNQPKAKQSKIVSLSNSPDILKLIALGEVEATIEQQAIKMGENLVIAALNQLQSNQEAYAPIDVELITKENLAQASSNDSIVPYSYRVIYTVN